MVLVALNHAAVALEVCLGIDRVLGQRVLAVTHTVRLYVGLVDNVETVLVAQVIPFGRVRIVARTYGIEVELLHDLYVLNHALARHDEALEGIYLVAVGTLDQYGLAVHKQQAVLDLRRAETYALCYDLGSAAAVLDVYRNLVEVGRLGRPLGGVLDVERQLGLAAAGRCGLLGNGGAGSIEKLDRGALYARGEVHLHVERGVGVLCVEVGRDHHVGKARLGQGYELHVTRDTAQTPQVLILEIRAVAPAEDLQGDEVLTRVNILRDVERCAEVAVLRVSDELAVDPYIYVRYGSADVEVYVAARPVGGDVDGAAV